MDERIASITTAEWATIWRKFYLPTYGVDGKTVLDIGAGCRETAYFYLQNGANRVIAVESDSIRASLLERNIQANGWNVTLVAAPFDVQMLARYSPDFLKMDIEGGEIALLDYGSQLPSCLIETHDNEVRNALIERFNLKILASVSKDRYLISNLG
jgi:tRNA G37 N-methylase Trm5